MEDGEQYLIRPSKRRLTTAFSAIFQAGGLVVVVVEVTRKAYLASLVPVIVDAILAEHQVIADIVAFVSQGDFPRSRLGEKQRGKVLASWVTRKLRTIAQFSIRDLEGSDNPFGEVNHHRLSRVSKPGSTKGTSIRQSTINPDMEPVPPSPAGVTLVDSVPASARYPGNGTGSMRHAPETPTDNSVKSTPVPEPTSAVPHIKEPQSATIVTEFDDHHYDTLDHPTEAPGPQGNFRFSFETATDPQSDGYLGGGRPSTGRDSLPSQQGWGYSNDAPIGTAYTEAGRPSTQDGVEDWHHEALMYQSALGADGHHPNARTPYDGSGYGP